MKKTLMAGALLAALASFGAHADDAAAPAAPANTGDWTGSGQIGFASAHGNSSSENINAKLGLNQENDQWKNNVYLDYLRSDGTVQVQNAAGQTVSKDTTTADRYDIGASMGYKLDPRSYIVTAVRYDHDDFGANLWQAVVSVGYGYIALKTQTDELSFEIGPGYKEYRPADGTETDPVTGASYTVSQNTQNEVILRGLVNYKHRFTENVSLDNTLLIEAGAQDKYYQDDLGLAVSMTKKLSLKVGYEVRYNTNTLPGVRSTDTLITTNLVYAF